MYHLYTDMPLIEGVGDEVTVFFVIVFLFLILCVAWVSTNIQELPFFSVIVIEFTRRHNRNSQQNQSESGSSSSNGGESTSSSNSSDNVEPNSSLVEEIINDLETPLESETSSDEAGNKDVASSLPKSTESKENVDTNNSASTITNPENDVEDIEEDLPASETELRQRRVAFFAKSGGNTESKNSSEVKRNTDNVENTEQKTLSNNLNRTNCESKEINSEKRREGNEATEEESGQGDKVTIRLKYLNDTQRNVEASLDDTIDQFRRAHFADELAANKLVRFIFNGQDLRNGSNTLQAYNVVDNSVIHCLITQANRQNATRATEIEEDGFDIGMLMFPCFGLILVFMWYLRFEYRQFFSGTSTVCLIGMTLLYIAAILAMMENRRRGRHHVHVE